MPRPAADEPVAHENCLHVQKGGSNAVIREKEHVELRPAAYISTRRSRHSQKFTVAGVWARRNALAPVANCEIPTGQVPHETRRLASVPFLARLLRGAKEPVILALSLNVCQYVTHRSYRFPCMESLSNKLVHSSRNIPVEQIFISNLVRLACEGASA